jgi:uncharacterized membrane protein YphA (DoxX/SURF4 family)
MMDKLNPELQPAWWALRLGLGLTAFLAGLDKFFNLLANWTMYLSPLAAQWIPVSADTFMRGVGLIEMAVGVALLTAWTRWAAYVACAWLLAIAVNLVTTGAYFDVAVRDVVMAIGAFTLARMTELREGVTAENAVRDRAPGYQGA